MLTEKMVCFGNNAQLKERIHKTYPYQIKKIKSIPKRDSQLVKPYSLAGTYTPIKWLVSKETLCCVGGQVKQLVDYQLEVDKGKLTAVANLKS